MTDPFAILAELRDGGWWVSSHYDEPDTGRTRWTLMQKNGVLLRGVGATDVEALTACAHQAAMLSIGVS